ncbi:MAG: type II toxin-antitoxin system PemK/MazF family toxin [Planctomycetes bacterium]|nr:type II toxin-antitoxin system PemK/MazF family toxin [Planctomycetota bacterium]
MPDQGEIVLVPVPFTDLSSHKKRPVIVLSNNEWNRQTPDVIVVAMTSQPIRSKYSLRITNSDLSAGHLNRPGTVRVDKVYTLAQAIVLRSFGRVKKRVLSRIRTLLRELFSEKK